MREIINDRLRLLEMRTTLPAHRMARLAPITRSILSGDYNRHAEGLASAAKDLLL